MAVNHDWRGRANVTKHVTIIGLRVHGVNRRRTAPGKHQDQSQYQQTADEHDRQKNSDVFPVHSFLGSVAYPIRSFYGVNLPRHFAGKASTTDFICLIHSVSPCLPIFLFGLCAIPFAPETRNQRPRRMSGASRIELFAGPDQNRTIGRQVCGFLSKSAVSDGPMVRKLSVCAPPRRRAFRRGAGRGNDRGGRIVASRDRPSPQANRLSLGQEEFVAASRADNPKRWRASQ
jgi:hypothetical protein